MVRSAPLKQSEKLILALVLLVVLFNPRAEAASSNYRVGGALGYGGSGLTQAVQINGSTTLVQRSEGPGMASIFVERMLSDYFSLGIEHNRGFSLGPFSMGSYFTGFAGRWYVWGPAATVAKAEEGESVLLVRRFTPFVGMATGVASAEIKRDNDQVPTVTGSGVYIGFRFGADYPLAPGIGIRPELTYSTTFYQNPSLPSTLSESALQCAFYMFL